MRNVRSVLLGLATLIILLTFVGFATFSPDAPPIVDESPEPIILAADAGSATGRVTAFVFANQLLSVPQAGQSPTIFAEVDPSSPVLPRRPPPTTTTSTTSTTQPPPTTTTTQPPTTTTTQPPTTTTTTTVPSGGKLTEAQMRNLAAQYFPAEQLDKAVLVAKCESNFDPSAYNPAGPYGGLYQHSVTYWDARAASAGWAGASVYDATANTAVTAWLWARDGWGHWPWCSAWADGQLGG